MSGEEALIFRPLTLPLSFSARSAGEWGTSSCLSQLPGGKETPAEQACLCTLHCRENTSPRGRGGGQIKPLLWPCPHTHNFWLEKTLVITRSITELSPLSLFCFAWSHQAGTGGIGHVNDTQQGQSHSPRLRGPTEHPTLLHAFQTYVKNSNLCFSLRSKGSEA